MSPIPDRRSWGVPYCRCLNSVPCWENKRRRKRDFMPPFSSLWSILHNVVLQDFYRGETSESLVSVPTEMSRVFKTCCFKCFDKEIKVLPVTWLPASLSLSLRYTVCVQTVEGLNWAEVSIMNRSHLTEVVNMSCTTVAAGGTKLTLNRISSSKKCRQNTVKKSF